jgi:hypothetical protein
MSAWWGGRVSPHAGGGDVLRILYFFEFSTPTPRATLRRREWAAQVETRRQDKHM